MAADAAVKAANIVLFRVYIAMAVDGKGYMLSCGDVGAVSAAVAASIEKIKDEGVLVNQVVISNASEQLFREYI